MSNLLKKFRKLLDISNHSKFAESNNSDVTQDISEKHLELLKELNQNIEKQVSFWGNVKSGITRGVASAIGATVIAAIAFSLFNRLFNTVDDIPIIKDIINQTRVEKVLDNQTD